MRASVAMRRFKLVVAGGIAVLVATVVSACTGGPVRSVSVMAAPERPAAALAAVPTADPMLTQQACAAAAISAAGSARVFHNQMAVIEKAAAEDDTSTMVTAADTIQRAFVQLAKGLATLSAKPLSPPVRAAIKAASASLSEISSTTYAGSTADINKRLTDVSTALAQACG